MPLNTAQKAALKADIPNNSASYTNPNAIAQLDGPNIAAFYNGFPGVDFPVWRTEVPTKDIFDSISWDKFTPVDAADATATYTNRLLLINVKQMNLQNMLLGRDTIDASKANIRLGLRDAVINLPAGASGVPISAGGASAATVMTACTRKARIGEKLLVSGSAATGSVTASLLTFEGFLSGADILEAMNS